MSMAYQKQRQFLAKMVELGRIPHALLFYGPDTLEQMTVALEFIKLANGQDKELAVNPDLFLLGPMEEEQEIKIIQVRELQAKLSLMSYASLFKSVIIEQAHCMNQEAQSALLKLLEEPKGKTIFILITEYPEILLPTIISRVERLRFYNYSAKIYSAQEIKKISEILKSDLAQRFEYAKELADDPQNIKQNLEIWLAYFRDQLLSAADQKTMAKLSKVVRVIQNTHYLLSTTNTNARLALEMVFLEW